MKNSCLTVVVCAVVLCGLQLFVCRPSKVVADSARKERAREAIRARVEKRSETKDVSKDKPSVKAVIERDRAKDSPKADVSKVGSPSSGAAAVKVGPGIQAAGTHPGVVRWIYNTAAGMTPQQRERAWRAGKTIYNWGHRPPADGSGTTPGNNDGTTAQGGTPSGEDGGQPAEGGSSSNQPGGTDGNEAAPPPTTTVIYVPYDPYWSWYPPTRTTTTTTTVERFPDDTVDSPRSESRYEEEESAPTRVVLPTPSEMPGTEIAIGDAGVITVEVPREGKMRITWPGDGRPVKWVDLFVTDAKGKVLEKVNVAAYPFSAVMELTSSVRFFGVTVQYQDGVKTTVIVPFPPPEGRATEPAPRP